MGYAVARNRLLYWALLGSLALHLLLLALIPPFASVAGVQSVELLSFVHVAQLQIRVPKPQSHARAAVAPVHAPPQPRVRAPRARVALPHAHGPVVVKPVRVASQQEQAQVYAAQARPGDTTTDRAPAAVPAASAPPPASESSAPRREFAGGTMPLGVDGPATLDPAIQKALQSLGVHVTLTIGVSSDGHTKSVAFTPPLSDAIEAQIRTILNSAAWDPATCGGGITCEAEATIKL